MILTFEKALVEDTTVDISIVVIVKSFILWIEYCMNNNSILCIEADLITCTSDREHGQCSIAMLPLIIVSQ